MVLLLCLQVFSGTTANGADVFGDNIIIDNYSPKTSIYEGESVNLDILLSNKSDETLENVYVSIDSSSSFYGNPTSTRLVTSSVTSGSPISVTLPLVYKGDGRDLNLTFTYKKGSDNVTERETLYIAEAKPKDTTPPSAPPNTTNYVPKLGTTSGSNIPTIMAGNSRKISIPVKNSSIYQARNVNITLKIFSAVRRKGCML